MRADDAPEIPPGVNTPLGLRPTAYGVCSTDRHSRERPAPRSRTCGERPDGVDHAPAHAWSELARGVNQQRAGRLDVAGLDRVARKVDRGLSPD
jgi:hypothetical protein